MKFKQPLKSATLVKRYKRFLADVELENGDVITVHCPNSGSMRGCAEPESPVMISCSDNPKRKYPHTLEMVMINGVWIGINTSRTNHLVQEALENDLIKEIGSVDTIKAEVKVSEKSRLDFLVTQGGRNIYVEVKNCTLVEDGFAMFPDAVTTRGTKHLQELLFLKEAGHDAYVFFCVQRMDANQFKPAEHIDPVYAKNLLEVKKKGVGVLAYQAKVHPEQIQIIRSIPVVV